MNRQERIKAGRAKHGVGDDPRLYANVQHLVSPIVGLLRLEQADGMQLSYGTLEYIIDRLSLVLDLAEEDGDNADLSNQH